MILPGCCCGGACVTGGVITKYVNATKVRPPGDTGGTHYTSEPYSKYDTAQAIVDGTNCDTPGTCGLWLVGADYGGLSSKEIESTVDDIMASCSGTKLDHNCYTESGTVDMTAPRFGVQRFGARKQWHGSLGIEDRDYPTYRTGRTCAAGTLGDPGVGEWTTTSEKFLHTAPQTYFRKVECVATCHQVDHLVDGTGTIVTNDSEYHSTSSVGRLTGIVSTSGSNSSDFPGGTYDIAPAAWTAVQRSYNNWVDYFTGFISDLGSNAGYIIDAGGGTYELWIVGTGGIPDWKVESVGPFTRSKWIWNTYTWAAQLAMIESVTVANDSATYSITNTYSNDYGWTNLRVQEATATITYSDAYTATDVQADANTALADWPISNFNLASLRTDSQLANIPLCIYDELPATAPGLDYNADTGMDDYSVAQVDGVWQKRAWHDPRDYVWVYNGNSFDMPSGFTGGSAAELVTGLRTGTIISHTMSGSERHFWFGAEVLRRDHTSPDSACNYQWVTESHAALSEDPLPPVTMRWPTKLDAQYDGETCGTPQPGFFPGPFRRQRGNEFLVVKEAQAIWPWSSVNYARPCGADKYAVDQTTVCCIEDTGSGTFTVKATGLAALPLATGGLAENDYIIVESGDRGEIYKVTGVTSAGTDPDGVDIWTISVGALIDTLPVYAMSDPDQISDGSEHLGRLRWPSASGICGRAAITTAFDSETGLVTITSTADLPYLRIDPDTGEIRVDLYDSSMSSVVANASLTRVSDTSFTFTHAAIPSAVWMTGHGVDWTHNDATTKRTGIYLKWLFNLAATDAEYPDPPTWFASTPGCISGTKNQFTYSAGVCPAVIAVLPSGSPEDFGNQVVYSMTDTFLFDPVYGALEMHMVELTMPDPFWQQPYKPDCVFGDTFTWSEDTGAGLQEYDEVVGESTVHHKCYAHRPMVEAAASIPSGMSLPSGVTLHFAGDIPPSDYYFPNGIPIGDVSGNYLSIWRPWSFVLTACDTIAASRPFKTAYQQFVTCPT